jgi:putative ABC transport system substrate-binding protein
MDRRAFICALSGGFVAAQFAAEAQPAGIVPRIGILCPWTAADPNTAAMRAALNDAGYVEGKSTLTEWRFANGRTGHLPALGAELVRLKPDALVAAGDLAIRALRQATTTIPIVVATDDLVGEGHVASLARPGGNVTGVSILASELNAKRLELVKEAVPKASRVAILWDPATGAFHLRALEATARSLRVELKTLQVRRLEDLDGAFRSARAWRAEAINVLASPTLHGLRQPIIEGAARNQLPAIYQWREIAQAGGLMSYGPSFRDVLRATFVQLGRVLKGAKPADLPVEQPSKFELIINLKTAKALGLTIPQSLLARADEVIQ